MKSLETPDVLLGCLPVVVGDAADLKRQADSLGLLCNYQTFITKDSLPSTPSNPVIFDTRSIKGTLRAGRVSATAGRASLSAVEAAVALWKSNKIDAIATAPINKEAIQQAGSVFPGHTEMLAALAGTNEFLMSFFCDSLRVILLTIHVSLQEAIKAITFERVLGVLELADRELSRFGLPNARIGVAGLNPHAGENGLFGSEEIEHMNPAIREARARGIDARGPLPGDTLFLRAARGEFDAVVACYHDQGLIPVKSLAFGDSAGVTLALPFVRTSVDHGTAFDIAGKGVADPRSMTRAITLAAELARREREVLRLQP